MSTDSAPVPVTRGIEAVFLVFLAMLVVGLSTR